MSYSLIDIPKENYQRLCTDTNPLYIPIGAMSGTDASFLQGGVVIGAWAVANAVITLEESVDAGVTFTAVSTFTADTITATGTFKFQLSNTLKPISPVARLKILPGAGGSLYVSKVFRSFCTSDIMAISGNPVPAGAATEITLAAIDQQLTDLDRDSGTATAETLRTVLATRHEAMATPLAARLSDGTKFIDAEALAVAQLTNGIISSNLRTIATIMGWDGVNLHRELLVDTSGRAVLAARHETVTTPLAVNLSDGTNFITTGAIAAAQKTVGTATKALDVVSFAMGWDSVTHRELLLDTSGSIRVAAADLLTLTNAIAAAAKPEYTRANTAVLHNFASTGITASAYTTVIATTAAKAIRWQFANTTGSWLQLASGAAGAETIFCQIPPGGAAEVDKMFLATTRISVTSDENVATGKLSVCSFV